MPTEEPIIVVDRKIEPSELARLVKLVFEDMVKLVVDVDREIVFRLVGRGEPLE